MFCWCNLYGASTIVVLVIGIGYCGLACGEQPSFFASTCLAEQLSWFTSMLFVVNLVSMLLLVVEIDL